MQPFEAAPGLQPRDANAQTALDRRATDPLAHLVRTCEVSGDALTFSGTITAVGLAPGAFSGSANAYQEVTYHLDSPSDLLLARGDVARGIVPPCNVTVSYEVQWNSPLVDHEAGGLAPDLFRVGDHQIVGTTRGFRRWVAVDTWNEPILATHQRVQDTRELLSARLRTE
ncbi:MAG: hypothetical protein U0527_01110 [Candidatus Eisenbacteria bacterium]